MFPETPFAPDPNPYDYPPYPQGDLIDPVGSPSELSRMTPEAIDMALNMAMSVGVPMRIVGSSLLHAIDPFMKPPPVNSGTLNRSARNIARDLPTLYGNIGEYSGKRWTVDDLVEARNLEQSDLDAIVNLRESLSQLQNNRTLTSADHYLQSLHDLETNSRLTEAVRIFIYDALKGAAQKLSPNLYNSIPRLTGRLSRRYPGNRNLSLLDAYASDPDNLRLSSPPDLKVMWHSFKPFWDQPNPFTELP